jgi:hypothetical protein
MYIKPKKQLMLIKKNLILFTIITVCGQLNGMNKREQAVVLTNQCTLTQITTREPKISDNEASKIKNFCRNYIRISKSKQPLNGTDPIFYVETNDYYKNLIDLLAKYNLTDASEPLFYKKSNDYYKDKICFIKRNIIIPAKKNTENHSDTYQENDAAYKHYTSAQNY